MVKGASCHKICVVVGEIWRNPTATNTKLPEMPNTPKASSANVRLEKLPARGSLPITAKTASKTSEADKKRAHTSVGASTAFKACCAATGSEPQVMVAKSASKKPGRGLGCAFAIRVVRCFYGGKIVASVGWMPLSD